jgi:hypothetical protein
MVDNVLILGTPLPQCFEQQLPTTIVTVKFLKSNIALPEATFTQSLYTAGLRHY